MADPNPDAVVLSLPVKRADGKTGDTVEIKQCDVSALFAACPDGAGVRTSHAGPGESYGTVAGAPHAAHPGEPHKKHKS
jgi:hypothetical protein